VSTVHTPFAGSGGPATRLRCPWARSGDTTNATASARPLLRLASSSAAASLWKIRWWSSGTLNRRRIAGTRPASEAPDGPSSQVWARSSAGPTWDARCERVLRAGDDEQLVVEERRARDRLVGLLRARADRHVHRPGPQQPVELARAVHAELDVEVVGAAGEQVDEPGRGVLGEQAGRGHPQQPATGPGLAHLEDRAVLQAQHLRGPAGQPQPRRG